MRAATKINPRVRLVCIALPRLTINLQAKVNVLKSAMMGSIASRELKLVDLTVARLARYARQVQCVSMEPSISALQEHIKESKCEPHVIYAQQVSIVQTLVPQCQRIAQIKDIAQKELQCRKFVPTVLMQPMVKT
jgi:hypothetical protein